MIIGGDQQTYSFMNNLKVKYGHHNDWLYPVPGDWHVMKTAAEVTKHVLQDGGFKQFSAKCEDITQWQDIHNVLVACHEAFLKVAVEEFLAVQQECTYTSKDFWVGIENFTSKEINEVTQFWSQMLLYLQAYVGFYFFH